MKWIQIMKKLILRLIVGVVALGSGGRQMPNDVVWFILTFSSMTSGVLYLFTMPLTSSDSSSYPLGYLTICGKGCRKGQVLPSEKGRGRETGIVWTTEDLFRRETAEICRLVIRTWYKISNGSLNWIESFEAFLQLPHFGLWEGSASSSDSHGHWSFVGWSMPSGVPRLHRINRLHSGWKGMVLEAIANHRCRFWHFNFGAPGWLNDLNILDCLPLFENAVKGEFHSVQFVVNGNEY